VVGQAHAALRRQINAEVRRYVDQPLARQTRLNYRLTELLQLIARDHGVALAQLRQQVGQADGLRMELDALRAELGTLRAELHGLRAEAEGARDELRRLRANVRLQQRAGEQGSGPDTALPLDYLAYNERIGGGIEHERSLYAEFLDLFAETDGLVLDLGCGRAPFLDLLRGGGRAGLGVDRDPRIVAYARAQGHRVIEADVLTFLETVEDGTLGGIFAAHLVEHLPRPALVGFMERCRRKLAPGTRAVFITPDPRSLFVLSDTFYKDLTHVAPIHPEALSFLAEQAGFASREIRTLSPVPVARRLEDEEEPGTWSPALRRNLAKMEEMLFGDLDYALIVTR
jgi:O-antigen chain-terminating methyltransferase